MKKMIAASGIVALGISVVAGPTTANAKPKVVWEDNTNDSDLGIPAGFDQSGFDLVSGSLARNGDNIEFTVAHAAMPPIGSLPEAARFLWAFSIKGTSYRITVKRADIGKPDVAQGQTTERVGRVDAMGHFRLEGDCTTEAAPAVTSFINCKPLAYLEGTWDPATASFTAIVPMDAVKAKTGSVLMPAFGDATSICPLCWVSHAAERSSSATLIDTAAWGTKWKVPK